MQRPNIILILIDDLGWKDLGCTGSHYYQTPHIDQMAEQGTLFTQAYAAAPVCTPSRGAIYSGQYPARNKMTAVCRPVVVPDDSLQEASKLTKGNIQNHEALHRHALPFDVPTAGQLMSEGGYRTGFIGKWHCGWHETQWPDRRGWQHAEGFRTIPAATPGHFGRDFIPFKCKGFEGLDEDAYMTDVLTDRAEAFMQDAAGADEPFFLTLSHYAVHTPLDAPEELIEKYRNLPTTDQDNPVYAAMVEKVDQSVGRVLQMLADLGIDEDTMVIFTSDNGGYSPNATSNYPLLGGKSYCYEAGMRVPLIVRWPGHVPAGRREATPTVSIDLLPTWLAAGGIDSGDGLLDGVSLMSLLTSNQRDGSFDRPIFFHHPHYTHATGPFSSIIRDGWKLIRFYNDTSGAEQLFDMACDPYEQDDLITRRPQKAAQLRSMLDAWLNATDAELPRPNAAFDPDQPPKLDKQQTYNLGQRERAEHERKWRASAGGEQHR